MSEFRRRLMMAQGGKPYNAKVEYLQTTGNQWVDTGLYLDGYTRFKVKFQLHSLSSLQDPTSASIFGTRKSSGSSNSRMIQLSTWKGGCFGYDRTLHKPKYIDVVDIDYVVEYGSNNKLYVNGVDRGTINRANFTTQCPLCICGLMVNNVYDECDEYMEKMIGLFYYLELYDNSDSPIANYIPVRVGGVGYIYDEVSNKLYRSIGSEDFIAGPDKIT